MSDYVKLMLDNAEFRGRRQWNSKNIVKLAVSEYLEHLECLLVSSTLILVVVALLVY